MVIVCFRRSDLHSDFLLETFVTGTSYGTVREAPRFGYLCPTRRHRGLWLLSDFAPLGFARRRHYAWQMSGPRILVVDDESALRSLVRPYLEAEGYEVIDAANGPAALMILEAGDVDLAIVDVMMPGFDGIELVKRVRMASDVPIILLTARREEGERIAGLRLGADDYVTKPFSVPELVARVSAQLRRATASKVVPDESVLIGDIEIRPSCRLLRWRITGFKQEHQQSKIGEQRRCTSARESRRQCPAQIQPGAVSRPARCRGAARHRADSSRGLLHRGIV